MTNPTLRNNFEIDEAPFWIADEVQSNRNVSQVLDNIMQLREAVLEERRTDPNFIDYTEYHSMHYVLDEKDGQISGTTLLFDILDNMESQDPKEGIKIMRIKNLYSAVKTFFSPSDQLKVVEKPIDIDFIKGLHLAIGASGVIENAGEFRSTNAAPRDTPENLYMKPNQIQLELQKLVDEANEIFFSPNLQLTDAVKYGACFFERFLKIHPFGDGNGRVARLLVSRLLSRFTVGPMNWFLSTTKRRNVYIECLERARGNNTESYSALARFILNAIETNYEICCKALDIFPKPKM